MYKVLTLFILILLSQASMACSVEEMINDIDVEELSHSSSQESMIKIRDCYLENDSYMAIFPSVYIVTTDALIRSIDEEGFYQNPLWMKKMILEFYKLYRNALVGYERGNYRKVPKSWMWAFRQAKKKNPSAFKSLLLAMHAHIDRDLAVALVNTGVDLTQCRSCTHDYFLSNSIFTDILDSLWATLKEFDPDVNRTTKDESFYLPNLIKALKKQRARAWRLAVKIQTKRNYNIRRIDSLANVNTPLLLLAPRSFSKITARIFTLFYSLE